MFLTDSVFFVIIFFVIRFTEKNTAAVFAYTGFVAVAVYFHFLTPEKISQVGEKNRKAYGIAYCRALFPYRL